MSEFILHQTLAICQGLTSRTDHSTPHHTRCLQPELGYSARPSTRKRPHSPSAAKVLRTARFLRDINAEVRTDLAHKLDGPEPRRVGMNARKWPTARRDDRGDLASAAVPAGPRETAGRRGLLERQPLVLSARWPWYPPRAVLSGVRPKTSHLQPATSVGTTPPVAPP